MTNVTSDPVVDKLIAEHTPTPEQSAKADKIIKTFDSAIVESPYSGDIEKNKIYAAAACKNCMRKGEIPFASHLFFPQFLDETNSVEREIGIQSGYFYWQHFSKVVFYIDNGISPGMAKALERAILEKKPYEFRQLPKER